MKSYCWDKICQYICNKFYMVLNFKVKGLFVWR